MIKFTQFLLPNGKQSDVNITRGKEVEAIAAELADAGHRFEIEMLSDYSTISITVEIDGPDGEEITRAHELVPNGPGVPPAIDKLMNAAYADWQGAT